jgi:hypothetical protein
MRVKDKPLPGDLVIRARHDRTGPLAVTVFVITSWPDAERVLAGPYQSFSYALTRARLRLNDPSEHIWRDHALAHETEQLEDVTQDE